MSKVSVTVRQVAALSSSFPLRLKPVGTSATNRRLRQCPASNALSRHLHTSMNSLAEGPSAGVQVPVSLIASLRKLRPVPMTLAREALQRTNNNLDEAVSYLDSASSASSAKKAEKVSGRETGEGVIAISLLGGKRVGMIHIGCETDFVARNDVFLKAARNIAGTTAFLDVPGAADTLPSLSASGSNPDTAVIAQDPILDFPVESLMSAPLITLPSPPSESASSTAGTTASPSSIPEPVPTPDPSTVSQTLLSTLSQTGENLKLLRAISFAAPFPSSPLIRFVPGAYTHGGTATEGKVGGVVVISAESTDGDKPMAARIHGPGGDELEKSLLELARTLARQIVGFPTLRIGHFATGGGSTGDGSGEEEETLLRQPAMMFGKQESVGEVLSQWAQERALKVNVVGFRRWAVSDDLEKAGSEQA